MVFSILHWAPSAIAAVCTILLAVVKQKNHHRALGYSTVFFASIGLFDYISQGSYTLLILDLHTIHSWIGLSALLLSVFNFVNRVILRGKSHHCLTGYAGAVMSLLALLLGATLLLGSGASPSISQTAQVPAASVLPEVEADEFQGLLLTPLSAQRNNAIQGTQYIDRESYRLHVTGLVENELNVTYKQLLVRSI